MDKDVLNNAIDNFQEITGWSVSADEEYTCINKVGYDGSITLKNSAFCEKFFFQTAKHITLAKATSTLSGHGVNDRSILLAGQINKAAKDYLKQNNVSYLEATGNAFISNGRGLYIYIDTQKKSPPYQEAKSRAFSKTGLKVIYQILLNSEVLHLPYREIGVLATVSIDTVSKVVKGLIQENYLLEIKDKKYKVKNKERLLQEWITVFNKTLRPKLKQQGFKIRSGDWQTIADSLPAQSIGGELGAEYYSNYLIAESATIYTDQPFVDVAKSASLIPSKKGEILLLEKFWSADSQQGTNPYVHPILVYADLLNDPKPRNLETAQLIYDKHVRDYL